MDARMRNQIEAAEFLRKNVRGLVDFGIEGGILGRGSGTRNSSSAVGLRIAQPTSVLDIAQQTT
eukprot:505062-Rhodomonas_salina.1